MVIAETDAQARKALEVIAVDIEHFPNPLDWRFHPDSEIEVEANGIYIEAPLAGGGRRSYTGTSFAVPHLSGIAARWKERNPSRGQSDFRKFLATK